MSDTTTAKLSFDPARSRFLLVAVANYHKGLDEIPNAVDNVNKLKDIIRDPAIIGVPEGRVRCLINPQNKSELSEAFHEAANSAEDLLFFYYVGHGLPGRETDRLFLATANSSDSGCDFDGFDFDEVRIRLGKPQPAKRIIILDCCFAGLALDGSLGTMEGLILSSIDIKALVPKSSYAIAAAASNQTADAGVGQPYTSFTGELIDLLEHGTGEPEPVLTMEKLFGHLEDRIRSKPSLPTPVRRQQHDGGMLILAYNQVSSSLDRSTNDLYKKMSASLALLETRLNENISTVHTRLDIIENNPASPSSERRSSLPLLMGTVSFCMIFDGIMGGGAYISLTQQGLDSTHAYASDQLLKFGANLNGAVVISFLMAGFSMSIMNKKSRLSWTISRYFSSSVCITVNSALMGLLFYIGMLLNTPH